MSSARAVVGRSAMTAARGYATTQTSPTAPRTAPGDEPPTPLFIPTGDYRWDRSHGVVFANLVSSPNHVSINDTLASPVKSHRRHMATARKPPPPALSAGRQSQPPRSSFRAVQPDARPTLKSEPRTMEESPDSDLAAYLDERNRLNERVRKDTANIKELGQSVDRLLKKEAETSRDAGRWRASYTDLQAELIKIRAAHRAEVDEIRDTHSKTVLAKNVLIQARDAQINNLHRRLTAVRADVRTEIIDEAHAEGLRIAEVKHEQRHLAEMRENERTLDNLLRSKEKELNERSRQNKRKLDEESREIERKLEENLRREAEKNQQALEERHRALGARLSEMTRQAARDLADARTERDHFSREQEERDEQIKEDANKIARSEFQARQAKFKQGYPAYRDAVQPPSGSEFYFALDSQAAKIADQVSAGATFLEGLPSIGLQMQSRVPGFNERYPGLCAALDGNAKAQTGSLRDSVQALDQYEQSGMRRGQLYSLIAHRSRQLTNALRYETMAKRDVTRQTINADILWPVNGRVEALEAQMRLSSPSKAGYARTNRRAALLAIIHAVVRCQQDINIYEELLYAPYAEKRVVAEELQQLAQYMSVLNATRRTRDDDDAQAEGIRENLTLIRRTTADLRQIVQRRERLEGELGRTNRVDEERINAIIREHMENSEEHFWDAIDRAAKPLHYHVTRRVARATSSTPKRLGRATYTLKPTARRASAHVPFTSALSTSDICRIWPAALPAQGDHDGHHQCIVAPVMASQHGPPPLEAPLSDAEASTRGELRASHARAGETKDLTYKITPEDFHIAASAPQTSPAAFWSYKLYRNPSGSNPVLHYCTKFEQAEEQAQKFLGATVLGFDIEWESGASLTKSRIKDNVSLIQIATEDRIGLFQLGMFKGDTIEELMPPSLRLILESPTAVKAGVNIGGDATRLKSCLGVNMCGLFELSHLYRIVRYSEHKPAEVHRRPVAMAVQVQDVLRLPLSKDSSVRTGAWSRKLNAQQCDYAGSDAYAGLRLYYELETQRQKMHPMPPRPAFYELWHPLVLGDGTEIHASKSSRPPRTSAQASVIDDEAEADEAYFDAVEDLEGLKLVDEDAALSDDKRIIYPSLPVDLVRDPARSSSISQTASAPKLTADKPKRQPPPKSVEVDRADAWVAEWKASLASNYKIDSSGQKLRAYHLWHEQGLDVREVGAKIGDPPLANMTVAKYVLDVVKDEDLAYDVERIKRLLSILPTKMSWRFQKIAEQVEV